MSKPLAKVAILLTSLAVAPHVFGQGAVDAAAGATLFNEGRTLMEGGKYAEACAKFEAADKFVHSPGLLLNLGDCHEKLGQLATAYGWFEAAGILARQKGDNRDTEADRRAVLLEPRLSRVRLDVAPGNRGAGVRLKRDGREIPEAAWSTPTPVDAGDHVFEASAPGKSTWKTTVHIDGTPGTTSISVPPLDADGSTGGAPFWNGQRIAGVAVGSAGVVGMVVGAAFGGITLSKASASKPHCALDLSTCDFIGFGLQQDAHKTANVSDAALAVGGAALVAGVVTFVMAPKATQSSARMSVRPMIGAQTTGITLQGGW